MKRRGFSLVEVMISVVVLTVGILALAGTSGAITRMISQGGQLAASALAVEGRIDILRATPCASLAGGSATQGQYALTWTVASSGFLRTVNVTVSYNTGRGTRTDTYQSTISCAT